MKCKLTWPLCAALLLCFCFAQCKKHKETPKTELEKLPPITQTGANTFGCLVDGKVFLPYDIGINPRLTCYYQYIYHPSPTGYVFQVKANNKGIPGLFQSINILCDSILLKEGNIYNLQESLRGLSRGNYLSAKTDYTTYNDYYTFPPSSGELYIKKFDDVNQIVSGTFWFNAISATGDTVKVTDGRFDMKFTK